MQTPFPWLIAVALLLLLVVQLWFIIRNGSLSRHRKWVRVGLNVLLWGVVSGYCLQLKWPVSSPATHVLLVGDEVPRAFYRQMQDSLGIKDYVNSQNIEANYDSVTLVGQQFPTETLTQLSNTAVQWIPYNAPNQLQTIRWKGIVRQGEMQRITGQVSSSEKQQLRLRFGNQTLDSLVLHEGENSFALAFPAFARKRTQVMLQLGDDVLDTLRFFTRPLRPITVQFILDSPDFESKTLANWLGKQGNTVIVSATLSKNISSELSINKAKKATAKTPPDLFITEPANASNVTIRKAIADRKAILFINLTNSEADVRAINQATGSRFQVRKTANKTVIPVGNGLNALPYRFVENLNQFAISGYPIAVQQTQGRVGISLLSETYPLALSGDSVAYNRVWKSVLAQLMPDEADNIEIDAPVYQQIRQPITRNNPSRPQTNLRVGHDTLALTVSPLNLQSANANLLFPETGWQPVQDSLAVFVNELKSADNVANRAVVQQFMRAHSQDMATRSQKNRTATAELPDWVWLVLLLICFTALWVEPKL